MLFEIVHHSYQTENVSFSTSIVEADSPEEALEFFNKVALTRSEYPYFWDQVKLKDVQPFVTLNQEMEIERKRNAK